MKKIGNAYIIPLIVGTAMITIGLLIQLPGGALSTYESLNGQNTSNYVFDNKFSAIDEYVGGDAYNYIIGASLVAGKLSGAMTTKAVSIVGGIMCVCFGLVLLMMSKSESDDE